MGQYYKPLLIHEDGTEKSAYSHDFGNGLKLMEHSWVGNNFVNAVLHEIVDKPTRVAWLGDYSNDAVEGECDFGGEFITSVEDFIAKYDEVWGESKSVEFLPAEAPEFDLCQDTKDCYLVNLTKQCYIDIGQYIEQNAIKNRFDEGDIWCINPLPLLTCIGNGLGGGDYRGDVGKDDVGSWAFDQIYITYLRPGKLKAVEYSFKE